jgi:hypothetical protein
MKAKKALLIGCGTLLFLTIAAIVVVALFVTHVSKDVEQVAITVNGPSDVVVGQTFDLEVVVKNQRSKKVLHLSDIDIAEVYLAGFTVSSTKPAAKSNMHVPIDNSRSYTFDVPVAAGATESFTFTLRAEKPGIYRGDVDVCEGMRSITTMAQTVVKDKE